jgi:phage portal protein BeeE
VGLADRVTAKAFGRRDTAGGRELRYSLDQWFGDLSGFPLGAFGLQQTMVGNRMAEIAATLPGYMAAVRHCPPVFAAQMVRGLVLSQARFTFRNPPWHPKAPRKVFGTRDLAPLERPWPNATTGQMVSQMEWHAGLAGNAYVLRQPDRLRVLRPDWVAVLYGSQMEPDFPGHALDGELIGYVYQNGGINGGVGKARTLLPADVAHWTPIPDPESPGMGMSWITPAIRDLQGDRAATEHKVKFFENGATPNLVVKGIPAVNQQQFDAIVDMMEANHSGVRNAYRTLYLTAGADASVVGSDMKQIDFKATQGAGETRISFLSRVPAPILGIAEGLAGSSLNAGNFGMARRNFSDTWVFPTLQDLAASLAPLVKVPADAEMWFDVGDVPLLREDAKDAAEITQVQATTIASLVKEGFTWESSVAAVIGQNMQLLQHTGLVSVQLQPPGTTTPTPAPKPAPKGASA